MKFIYNSFKIEVFRIWHKKWSRIMLIFTVIGFPLLLWAFTLLAANFPKTADSDIAMAVGMYITMSLFVLFIPLWITVFIGKEFSSNHVNKIVFLTSRKEYFLSKIIYCFIIALLFTVIESVSIALFPPGDWFQSTTRFAFVGWFVLHSFLINILYTHVFLCLTFALRSPVGALLTAYFLPQLDGIIYTLFGMVWHIKLDWLPFKLLDSLYVKGGYSPQGKVYYNPVYEGDFSVLPAPVLLVVVLCYLTYRWFLVRDLKTMSD